MALDRGMRGRDQLPRPKPRPSRATLNDRVHHELPRRREVQTFIGQALVNPRPDRQAELRVLGSDGVRALEEARRNLRRKIEATYVPRLEAAQPQPQRRTVQVPRFDPRARGVPAQVEIGPHPRTVARQREESWGDALMAQTGLDTLARESARRAPSAAVSGAQLMGPSLYRKLGGSVEHPSIGEGSTPLAIFEAATLFSRPLRLLPSAYAGAKAVIAGRAAGEATREAYRASGPVVRRFKQRGTRTFQVGDHTVTIPAARSRTGRVLERVLDSVMPEGATQRRAGRERRYSIEHTMRLRNADVRELKRVGRSLKDDQEYALRVLAEGVLPEQRIAQHIEWAAQGDELSAIYHGIHADLAERAAKYVEAGPDGRPVLKASAPPKLHRAWALFDQVGETREFLLRELGRLTDEQIAARIHAPGRVYSGARYRTFEAEVRRQLAAHPARDAYFMQLDAMLEPGQAAAQKVLFDAAVRSAAERAGDPMAVGKILDHLEDVRRSAGPPQGALLQDDMLDAATTEVLFRLDSSADPVALIAEVAAKYGVARDVLEGHLRERGELLIERILSNREVWKEGDATYDLARGVQATLGESGGHTWNSDLTSFLGERGFAVGVSAERGLQVPAAEFGEAAVRAFREQNADVFDLDPTLKVGSWRDDEGVVHLDISAVVDDPRLAVEIGRREGQLEVYDLARGKSFTLDELSEASRLRLVGSGLPYPRRPTMRRIPGETDEQFASRSAAVEQDYMIRLQAWRAQNGVEEPPDFIPPDWLGQGGDLFPGPIFRSAVEDTIRKMPEKFGAQELLGRLKSAGVKDEEIKWAALDTFLRGKKSVSRDEVIAWLDMRHLRLEENLRFRSADELRAEGLIDYYGDHEDMARFGTYTLPGGAESGTYRELTIRLPEGEYGPLFIRDSHFPEQNVLVHVRFTERTVDGKRTLFIEEIQSDWHQAGQKRGYRQDVREHPDYEMRVRALEEASEALDRARMAFENPPNANTAWSVQESIDALEKLRRSYAPGVTWRVRPATPGRYLPGEERPHDVDVVFPDGRSEYDGRYSDFHAAESRVRELERLRDQYAELGPSFDAHIEKLETLKGALRGYEEARSLMQALERDAAAGVPDAPFRKTWHELAFKRMLAWAVENGYERVAWTTGRQQAERYDLANFFERVEIRPLQTKISDEEIDEAFERWLDYGGGRENLPPFPQTDDFADEAAWERALEDYYEAGRKLAADFREDYIREQQPWDAEDTFELRAWESGNKNLDSPDHEQTGTWDELDEYVGPDLAQRAREGQELFEGKDLAVGAHGKSAIGAAKFYDDKLVGFANKYLKRFKVGVKTRRIGSGDAAGEAVHSIEITPEVRAFVEAGQLLFQRGGSLERVSPYGYKGAIEFTPQQTAILHLFESADTTTFSHELAHFIRRFGLQPEDERRVAKWAGAEITNREARRAARRAGEKVPPPEYAWTREAEEKFARGVEQFIRTGQGPTGVKQAIRSLSREFREVYEQADLPDVPPHVAKFFSRLFEHKPLRGGRLFGAEDVAVGVAYAPTWRGMPVKITEPQKAMAAYIRRTVSLFGGGGRRAVGAGPDDVHLRKAFTGSSLLSGFFRRDVIGPKVESAILANRMAAVPEAHRAMVEAGSPIPRDVTDIAVKIDPTLETPDALKVFWDKIASVEGGQRKLGLNDLEDVNFELIEAVRGDIFPSQLDGRDAAQVAAEILETQAPIDNIVWVPQDFLDSTGLLHVPASARAYRSGMSKLLRRGLEVSGLGWDALNDFAKAGILYLNPAYVPMQLVGNGAMNLMQQGVFMPVNVWRSVFLHREMSSLARVRIDSIMGVGAATALSLQTTPGQFVQATIGKWANVAADLVPRRAAFLHEAWKSGYRKGADIEELLESARRGDPEAAATLEDITRRAKRAIVDFDRLSPFERNVVSRWIFFYPWLRGATDWSIHFVADHPMQAMALALAADHVRAEQEEQLGDRPHYAQLDIPISTRTAGLSVPGTDLGVSLDQLVGERTWVGPNGDPMVFNLRQALTITTPLELAQIGIGFATGNNVEAAADAVQMLTPVPYAAGVSLFGYDPFIGREVEPGLNRFFSEFGPTGFPLADRYRALNMSEEERKKKNERSIHPREYRHEWWRVFGGGLAPTPYSTEVGQRQALEHAPLIERRRFELIQVSKEAGLGKPPPAVLEDLEWATKVDEAIERGDKWSERLQAVAEVYDERYPGRGMEKLAQSVRTEHEARVMYEQLRPLLYPLYAEWNRQLDRILDQRLEAEPVG